MRLTTVLYSAATVATTSALMIGTPTVNRGQKRGSEAGKLSVGSVTVTPQLESEYNGDGMDPWSWPTTLNRFASAAGCEHIGEPCYKARRDLEFAAITHKRATKEAAAIANRNPEPEAEADPQHRFCYRPGEPCYKVKRAAEAAAAAMAAPEPVPEAKHRFCYRPGEPCYKARRDELELAAKINKAARDAVAPATVEGAKQVLEARAALAVAHAEAQPAASAGKFRSCCPITII